MLERRDEGVEKEEDEEEHKGVEVDGGIGSEARLLAQRCCVVVPPSPIEEVGLDEGLQTGGEV